MASLNNISQKSRTTILAALGILFWLASCLSAIFFISPQQTVQQLMFGFGPYVAEMLRHGAYADCSNVNCDHSSRMPFVVLFVSFLSLASEHARIVAVLKTLTLGTITLAALRHLWIKAHSALPNLFLSLAGCGIVLLCSAPVIKHVGNVNYEEAFSLPFMFLLGISLPLSLSNAVPALFRKEMSYWSIAVGVILYLTKSSLLLIFIVTLSCGIYSAFIQRSRGLALAAIAALIAPLTWALHNQNWGGRFTIMTSWEGENLHRAWNGDTARAYPFVEIDRVFYKGDIALPSGEVLHIESRRVRSDFADEWTWSDTNRDIAESWLRQHPRDALTLLFKKFVNYNLSLQKTPVLTRSEPGLVATLQDLLTTLWLAIARACSVALILLVASNARQRRDTWTAAASTLALLIAYAIPCLVGFNYERHITTGLVLALGSLVVWGAMPIPPDSHPHAANPVLN
jgi:hypothetical protein